MGCRDSALMISKDISKSEIEADSDYDVSTLTRFIGFTLLSV